MNMSARLDSAMNDAAAPAVLLVVDVASAGKSDGRRNAGMGHTAVCSM